MYRGWPSRRTEADGSRVAGATVHKNASLALELRPTSLALELRPTSLALELRHTSLALELRHISLALELRHTSLALELRRCRRSVELSTQSGGDRLPSACPRQHSSLAALPSSHRRQWGRLSVSLQGAKVLAVRYQRLRRAIECVRLSRDVPRETSPHVDGPGAAAAETAWAPA
jgi:hypothetical protein